MGKWGFALTHIFVDNELRGLRNVSVKNLSMGKKIKYYLKNLRRCSKKTVNVLS